MRKNHSHKRVKRILTYKKLNSSPTQQHSHTNKKNLSICFSVGDFLSKFFIEFFLLQKKKERIDYPNKQRRNVMIFMCIFANDTHARLGFVHGAQKQIISTVQYIRTHPSFSIHANATVRDLRARCTYA